MRLNEAPSERQSGEMPTDCVGWGRMATCADSYESEGRLFESAWAHPTRAAFSPSLRKVGFSDAGSLNASDDRREPHRTGLLGDNLATAVASCRDPQGRTMKRPARWRRQGRSA